MTVTATIPVKLDINGLDPSKIELAEEYTLLEHLYSPLIELNDKGELTSGIASKFEWIGTNAEFTIRNDITLKNGDKISPEDVVASIKRLMILNQNSHGKISSLLCPERHLKTLEEDCSRITIDQNKVIFKLDKVAPFLFKLLASIDYAIIPKKSLDQKTLKIKDYKNSTGPYQLESVDEDAITLTINRDHYHYSKLAPQKIKYVVPKGKSLDLLKNGNIDIITTDDITSEPEELVNAAISNSFNIHKTLPIETNVLVFTTSGINKMSSERRLKVGKAIRKAFAAKISKNEISETSYQFFPALGDGALSEKQEELALNKYKELDISKEDGHGVILSVPQSRIEFLKKVILPILPKLKLIETKRYPDIYDNSGEFGDMVIVRTDTGFLEEISLISYSMNFGFFGLDKTQNLAWIENYMRIEDKNTRLKQLKDLHLKALLEPIMVPLYNTSYVVLSNKKWSINFSQLYSNSQLWRLRKND